MILNSYLEFENKFRGDTQSILSQFSKYDPLIDLIISYFENPVFIDIGSGRGEWLQKWSVKVKDTRGIENDKEMISISREKGLEILAGNALEILKNLPSNSVSVLTMFHVIEHIEHSQMTTLLEECYRVLSKEGIFILETPSIDNLIVSTNTFYLDNTHVSHINPEAMKFLLNRIGFDECKDYYINGGPMRDDKHSKITRIFNGVAQDLSIIATKSNVQTHRIFYQDTSWQRHLNQSPKTMEASVDFDLINEKLILEQSNLNSSFTNDINNLKSQFRDLKIQLKEQLIAFNELNDEVNLLKSDLRIVLKLSRIFNKVFFPFYNLVLKIKKYIRLILLKIFNKIISNHIIKKLIFSNSLLNVFDKLADNLPLYSLSRFIQRQKSNLERYNKLSTKSLHFNKFLLSNYDRSKRSKNIAISLKDNLKDS